MLLSHLTPLLALLAAPATAKPDFYRLKTTVVKGDHKKNNLYVQSYHTGAGLNDVALTRDETGGSKGFLNGTYQQFDLSSGSFPSGLSLAYNQFYTEWLDARMNAGYGDEGFSFNASGLISDNEVWRGWLACDWYHGVPQLFWQYYYTDIELPSSCAKVELHPVDLA